MSLSLYHLVKGTKNGNTSIWSSWASTGMSASQHHQPSGCYVPVSGESRGKWQNLPVITWQPRTLVHEHLMVRQLPFHALTSSTAMRCPWRMLLWSYVGAIQTSKLGDTSPGQGCSDMSISAVPSKDASTEASVLPINLIRARVSWTKTPVLHLNWFINPA